MSDTTTDTLVIIVSILMGILLYIGLYLVIEKPWLRLRIMCTCGFRKRGLRSQWSARMAIDEHLMKCRGKAIASPLPAPAIAEAAEK